MGLMNPDREIKIGDNTYTLRYTLDSLTSIEDRLGESCVKVFTKMDKGKLTFKELQAVLFAGIDVHHPGVTFKQFGQSILPGHLVDGKLAEQLTEAIHASMPKADPDKKVNDDSGKTKR